jgi:hypothetical protein
MVTVAGVPSATTIWAGSRETTMHSVSSRANNFFFIFFLPFTKGYFFNYSLYYINIKNQPLKRNMCRLFVKILPLF